jgi:hypothetical protein
LLKVVFGLIGVSNRRVRVNGRLCFVGSTCANAPSEINYTYNLIVVRARNT